MLPKRDIAKALVASAPDGSIEAYNKSSYVTISPTFKPAREASHLTVSNISLVIVTFLF